MKLVHKTLAAVLAVLMLASVMSLSVAAAPQASYIDEFGTAHFFADYMSGEEVAEAFDRLAAGDAISITVPVDQITSLTGRAWFNISGTTWSVVPGYGSFTGTVTRWSVPTGMVSGQSLSFVSALNGAIPSSGGEKITFAGTCGINPVNFDA